jgi:hypothetical protein
MNPSHHPGTSGARFNSYAHDADHRPEPPTVGEDGLVPDFSTWPDGRIDGFFETEPPPVAWFCEERLLSGRGHVLAGLGGSSKTRLLYHLGIGAVLGRLPWDWKISTTGSAALFLTEDVRDQVHRVIFEFGRHLHPDERELLIQRLRIFPLADKQATLLRLHGNTLQLSAVYGWLMSKVDLLPQPVRFIGIDPARRISEGDEASQTHQYAVGHMTDHMGIESGACAMLSAHAPKGILQAEELNSHSSRGAGAITDAVRGEFVVRNMTAGEALHYGITDIAERRRYVQLVGGKGNELPPEAYVPVWLRRGSAGLLEAVILEQIERGTVGASEMKALELLRVSTRSGESTMKFWRADCVAAGLIRPGTPVAQEKSMERIRDSLLEAGEIKKGTCRGCYVPTSPSTLRDDTDTP